MNKKRREERMNDGDSSNTHKYCFQTLGDSCSVEQPPPPPIDFTRSLVAPASIQQSATPSIISSAPGTPTAFQPPQQSQTASVPGIQPNLFNPALMAAQLNVFNNPQIMAMMQVSCETGYELLELCGIHRTATN
uniref:Uncharacterized protein n=1 Tax=Caenorhabditis japonica TaxID=281687 RepID=A0A8R1E5B5_CAEJA